ncbi:MAG: alpha/beta hydrolase [Bacteroidota bacterium]
MMPNKTIYAIPGLGVDERIFYALDLEAEVVYLNWLQPHKEEPFDVYVARMAEGIKSEDEVILLGLSFGGVVAQEIAKIRPVSRLILLSTMKSSSEKPWKMELMKHIPLYYLSQGSWRIPFMGILAPFFGIKEKADIDLIQDMFRQFDDAYRMWAIRQICEWEGHEPKIPYLHIHGSKDRIFPISNIKKPEIILGGNHYMVKQRAEEVSEKINAWI